MLRTEQQKTVGVFFIHSTFCHYEREDSGGGVIPKGETEGARTNKDGYPEHGCQMAIARFLDYMCLALWACRTMAPLRYAAKLYGTLQNLIPSFPWIAPGWRAEGAI